MMSSYRVERRLDVDARRSAIFRVLGAVAAMMLAGLEGPDFPVALGVLYDDPAPTYEGAVRQQIAAAKARGLGVEKSARSGFDESRHAAEPSSLIEALEDTTLLEIKSPAQPLEQFLGMGEG